MELNALAFAEYLLLNEARADLEPSTRAEARRTWWIGVSRTVSADDTRT